MFTLAGRAGPTVTISPIAMPTAKPTKVYLPQNVIHQARALYVLKGMPRSEIAAKLNLPPDTVSRLVSRHGWAKELKARLARFESQQLANANDANAAFLESMALQSEELAEDGMQMAREFVQRRDDYAAKDFASATQGVKNLVEIFRKVRGIDGAGQSAGVAIGAVYINAQPARPTKSAEQEPIDVSAEAIQQTEKIT
jgi:hypothetical protein